VVVDWFITPPLYSITLDFDFGLRIAVFALSALLVGWLSERRRRTEDALRLSRDELEARVQARTADLSRSNARLEAEIVARVRVEETLREQAALLDLTHDTVFVCDDRDVIVSWNRGAEALYGWTAEQAEGKIARELLETVFPVPRDCIMAELLSSGRWDGELGRTKQDGTQVVVASRWSLQRDARSTPVAALETDNDITERKRAEEERERLRQLEADLARINRVSMMGELAASLGHEITQPIAGAAINARACLRWLQREPPDIGEARQSVSRMVNDVDRAAGIIERNRWLCQLSRR